MKKRQRLIFALCILGCLAAAACLALFALRDNVSFFYSPSDVARLKTESPRAVEAGQRFRLGGLVKEGSLRRSRKTPKMSFVVTDGERDISVSYAGILPDLFREKQGVVAIGALTDKGVFEASEILAKHDEEYKPPALKKALQEAK